MLPTFLRCFVAIQILIVISAQRLPNSEALVISELEHLYFDATGPNGFMSGLTPCTTYIDSSTTLVNNTLGRQTSGQWLRTAFRRADFSLDVTVFAQTRAEAQRLKKTQMTSPRPMLLRESEALTLQLDSRPFAPRMLAWHSTTRFFSSHSSSMTKYQVS